MSAARRAPRPAARRPAAAGPVARLRRLLLLVPAAWNAGPAGLPLERAVRVTGARSPRELEELVASVGGFDLGPVAAERCFSIDIEDGRVVVGDALRFTRPPPLSFREGAALVAALRPFEKGGGRPVAAALRKLRRAIPEPFRARADRLARATEFALGPPGEWADTLQEAIDRRREVTLEYRAEATGHFSERRLHPRLLFPQDGRWYLAAWNPDRGAEHLYRLDRIARVEQGTATFGEHRGPPLERYRTPRLYFLSGNEQEVRVRFTGAAAQQAREQWPQAAPAADGSVTVTARLAPGNYLLGWVLGHGGQAEVLSPPAVRDLLRQRVEALARLYAG